MNQLSNELVTMNDGINADSIGGLPALVKRGIKNEGGLVIKQTVVAGLHEQGRAMLANTVLENVGSLSAMEEFCCQLAPNGAERYKTIVDAYTIGAAQKIARW
jgi:hypothetical protein